MNQNHSQRWSFFANPTAAQITVIVNRIRNYKRWAYATIICDKPDHYGVSIGFVVFNIGRTLNWLQQNISPIAN
jgi:hypothetical protein